MRHVTDDERRARLAIRHLLVPELRAEAPEDVASALVALHATEPATVFLSCWARVRHLTTGDVERALYRDRSLVKQLAMRRTLFAFPRDLLPAVWPSAAARVAGLERTRIVTQVQAAGLAHDGQEWLDLCQDDILAALRDAPDGRSALELRHSVPRINTRVPLAAGSTWAATAVLTYIGAVGGIVRGDNLAHWRTSRPLWTLTESWLGAGAPTRQSADGYRELVGRWLRGFGPGTTDDLVWWLGGNKTVVRHALADLGAVAVSLDGGQTGWLLPDDLAEVAAPRRWAALLPVLDPTVMGWNERRFYLGPHSDQLFDSRGNAGTTAWVDGRVRGCWVQDDRGTVQVRLLERVDASSRDLLETEAARLTAWLAGERVGTVVPSPAMR